MFEKNSLWYLIPNTLWTLQLADILKIIRLLPTWESFNIFFLYSLSWHVNSAGRLLSQTKAEFLASAWDIQSKKLTKGLVLGFTWFSQALALCTEAGVLYTGPILDIRGMGVFFGANVFKKKAFCLLTPLNQMSFLTTSNENVFFENQGTRLGATQ